MLDFEKFPLIIYIFIWLLLGLAGGAIAFKRRRNPVLWFFTCIFSGIFGILVVACSTTLEYDEEAEKWETDTLGRITFIISLIFMGCVYYFYFADIARYHRLIYY